MKSLESIITKEAVESALKKAIRDKPVLKPGTEYELIYDGQSFPPKEIVRLAGGVLGYDAQKFKVDGSVSKKRLEKLGFRIERKNSKVQSSDIIQDKISRICWNESGWKKPSGISGKSKSIKLYENKNGYGHEEWLLDFTKKINGYHYSSLIPIYKFRDRYEGNKYNILLYTIDANSSKKFWIGEIKNVTVIPKAESDFVIEEYKKRKWFNQMQDDLKDQNLKIDLQKDFQTVFFNIKFREEDYFPFSKPILIDSKEIEPPSFYYVLLNRAFELNSSKYLNGKFDIGNNTAGPTDLEPTKRFVEPKSVEVRKIHNQISLGLQKVLSNRYPKVVFENPTGNGTEIDLVAQTEKDEIFFYEIKTYDHILNCIREALGQLMEYNYYPNRKLAKRLYIVTQHEADPTTVSYIKHLKAITNLPIHYICFDLNTNTITQEI